MLYYYVHTMRLIIIDTCCLHCVQDHNLASRNFIISQVQIENMMSSGNKREMNKIIWFSQFSLRNDFSWENQCVLSKFYKNYY